MSRVASLVQAVAVSLPATVLLMVALAFATAAVGVLSFGLRVTGAAALYFVVWWLSLFAVLPVGARSQAEAGEVVAGSEPGAPPAPLMREKAIWTSLVATAVFGLAVALMPLAGL